MYGVYITKIRSLEAIIDCNDWTTQFWHFHSSSANVEYV